MSVRLEQGTDKLQVTLGAALTIGTGGVQQYCWFKRMGNQGTWTNIWTLDNTTSWLSLGTRPDGSSLEYTPGGGNQGGSGFATTQDVWYFALGSRFANSRLRVWTEDGSKVFDQNVADTTSFTGVTHLTVGDWGGGDVALNGEVCAAGVSTADAEWSDAEAWAQAQTWLLQKSGGTDRHAFRLAALDDSTAGLHSCTSTALLVNTGVVVGASRPSCLEYDPLASDDFNRANENPIASPWSAIAGGFTGVSVISGNNLEGNGTDGPVMHATTMPNDHWSEIIMKTGGGGLDIGPMVRCSTGKGYLWALNATGDILYSTAGSFVNSGVSRARNAVDEYVFRLEAVGGVLRCYENGVQVGADVSDSNVPTGTQAGTFSFSAISNVGSWAGGRFGVPVTEEPVAQLPGLPRTIRAAAWRWS